ncbi:MAG: zinc ABC transporter substrate-binding protein [Simkaniaceae bacterium]|nr:MAG: zinc ABC transporter substrate-binding protein [Simkaniaceae bacterium]
MKKWLILIVACICIFYSCGTGVNNSFMEPNGKTKVLSTTAMIDDLVAVIGGKEIDHTSLIIGDLDPHSYELVKGDDEKLLSADVIFYNGLGLEHGASLRGHLESHSEAVGLGDLLYRENPAAFITIDGLLDPHFWMDVALFSQIIDPIVTTLSEKDPDHAELFRERGTTLKAVMIAKDRALMEEVQTIPSESRYLVTSHDAFYYFAKKYLSKPEEENWEKRFMAPEGLAPDGQMSILDIQAVSEFLCEHQIHVVFPETNINQDALKKIVSICREKGLRVKIATTPLYGDTMGSKGTGADSYLEMIEHNVRTLKEELSQESL